MATSGELSKRLGVSDETIRQWSGEFGNWLSAVATPTAPMDGRRRAPRYFTDDDVQVLHTVAALRSEQKGYDEIKEVLQSGYRVESPPEEPSAPETGETGTGLTIQQMTATLGRQQGMIEQLREERDRVLVERDGEREKRLDAEIRATRAEATLEAYQVMRPVQPPTEAPSVPVSPTIEVQASDPLSLRVEVPRKSWWDRLRGR